MTSHLHCAGGKSPEYRVWNGIVQRTTNFNNARFETYGGKIDPSFLGPGGFERWLAVVGKRPSLRHTLDRIDPHGGYTPGNMRWATRKVQRKNVREYERVFYGRPISVWAKLTKVKPHTVRKRLLRKMDHSIVFPERWRL